MASGRQADALRGTIDLLALKAIAQEATHGWGIGQRIEVLSRGTLEVNQGSLYPALQRLEYDGLITSDWGTTENGRRARYYKITAAGKAALATEIATWQRFSAAIDLVIAS